jgi:hypothetical protein
MAIDLGGCVGRSLGSVVEDNTLGQLHAGLTSIRAITWRAGCGATLAATMPRFMMIGYGAHPVPCP